MYAGKSSSISDGNKGGFKQVFEIETNCLVVVQTIRSTSSVKLSYIGRLVDECKIMSNELKDREMTLRFVR